jgi:hypothetical protein
MHCGTGDCFVGVDLHLDPALPASVLTAKFDLVCDGPGIL